MKHLLTTFILSTLLFAACGEKFTPDYSSPEGTLEAFVVAVDAWDEKDILDCMVDPESSEFGISYQKDKIIDLYSGVKCNVLEYYNNDSSVVFSVPGRKMGGSLQLDSTGNWKIFVYMNQVINPFE
jgi:hypothetical protein